MAYFGSPKTAAFIIVAMAITTGAFADEKYDFKSIPSGDQGTALSGGGGSYYVGMTKDALYKVYPRASQQNDYKQGNEEWMVFDDILTTGDLKDIITFYLKDGKIVGWDKKMLPKTPEDRLKVIEMRHGHSIGTVQGGGMFSTDELRSKERTRRQRVEGGGDYSYYRGY